MSECHHGRLKRQCQECDMEQEIKELKEQNAELIKALDNLLWKCVEVDSNVTDSDAWHQAERLVK